MSFPVTATFRTGTSFPVANISTIPIVVTNTQKRGLSPSTPVGTKVSVNDGFVVNGSDADDGFYYADGGTSNSRATYTSPSAPTGGKIAWGGSQWTNDNGVNFGTGLNPWTSAVDATVTHPAIQQLAAPPSTAQGGVFVSGETQDGVYTKRSGESYPFNGKDAFVILGVNDGGNPEISGVAWTANVNGDFGSGPNSSGFAISDDGGGLLCYSPSNVVTPDLVPINSPVVFIIDFVDLEVPATDSSVLYKYGQCGSGGPFIIEMDGTIALSDSYFEPGLSDGNLITCGCYATDPDSPPTKQQCIDKLVAIGSGNISDMGGQKIRVSVANNIEPLLFAGGGGLRGPMTGSSVTTHNAGWFNAGDDSPASITVTSVTNGQLAAGIKFGSTVYSTAAPINGRNTYHDVLDVAPDFTFNGTIWTDDTHNGTGTPAFPWNVTGITITQDDVASEANWSSDITSPQTFFPAPPIHF